MASMHDDTLHVLCTDAGLGAEVAAAFEAEEITVDILVSASLVERREILRSMGLRFGQIMSLNQALERLRVGSGADAEGAEEADEDDDGAEGEEDGEGGDATPKGEAGGQDASTAAASSAPGPPADAGSFGPKLQAAAVLLRGAEVHTLRGLQVYLNNVLQHPDKVGFRTIQLSNPLFQQRVWAVPGGASALRAAGFAEGPRRTLRLLDDAPLEPLRAAKDMVEALLAELYPGSPGTPSLQHDFEAEAEAAAEPPKPAGPAPPKPPAPATPATAAAAHGHYNPQQHRLSDTPAASARRGFNAAAEAAAAVAGSGVAREVPRNIAQLLEGAHTSSWDAALANSGSRLDASALSAVEIRCCRACNQGRLAALLGRVARTLWQLGELDAAALAEARARSRFLNVLRLLTRLLPLLLEDGTDVGVQHLMWTRLPAAPFPEAAAAAAAAAAAGGETSHFFSLGGCVCHALLAAHFVPGFTLLSDPGGANPWATSSGTMDEARDACLEALLSCCSGVLFTPPGELGAAPNWPLLCAVFADDAKVKALFRALLCVVFSYDPVGWGVPYAHALVSDTHQQVLHHGVQLLLVLLSQPLAPRAPGDDADAPPLEDKMVRLLCGLQRPETLAFVISGFGRLLRNAFATQRTYLPGSLVSLDCQQELLLLLWKFAHHSRPFLLALLASPQLPDVLMALCFCVLSWAHDVPKSSLVHLCVLTLLVFSAEPDFGAAAAAACPHPLPLRGRAARATSASLADLVLISCAEVVIGGHERLECVYPAALAVLANLVPHVKALSADSTGALLQCLAAFVQPAFLFGAPSRPEHLIALLEVVNAALLYPPTPNVPLVHGLVLLGLPLQALPVLAPPRTDGALEAESEAFVATVAWTKEWQSRLPLDNLLLVLDALLPKLPPASSSKPPTAAAVGAALRAAPLSGVLPPAPPMSVRRYQPNEFSYVWITQVLWGVVYSRNQHLYDARMVRLVQVVQAGQ